MDIFSRFACEEEREKGEMMKVIFVVPRRGEGDMAGFVRVPRGGNIYYFVKILSK